MTKRNLNYTDRQRIVREDVDISVEKETGEPPEIIFNADLSLGDYSLPDDAAITVEAYRDHNRMRFDFGSVGEVQPPGDRKLTMFETQDAIKFRVLVTSQDDPIGLILAVADSIPLIVPSDTGDIREPLLPVRSADIGNRIFDIDFSGSGPGLVINSELETDWHSLVLTDSFATLAYPSIVREIFIQILLIDNFDGGNPDDWQTQWLNFAMEMPNIQEPSFGDEDRILIWISDVVDAFCRRLHLIRRFRNVERLEGEL